ncbi:tRNA wybutosine-synthesizing protein 3 [Sarcoptes scabiei]|nr:tRNA wybutosine-synthesizing protein 3 [Sarcoptes scabiei]
MSSIIPKISNLSNRVIRVLGCNPGHYTLQGTNTYILGTGKRRLLIDCGEQNVPEYIQNLKKVLEDNLISLQKIILTHWHPDHVGGTKDILNEAAEKDCKVYKFYDAEHDESIKRDDYEFTYLEDNDEVSVEGANLKVFHTPGHSKDHLVIYLQEEKSLFSGDCILGEGTVVFEDLVTYLKSLSRISSIDPKKLYPGHGPVVEDPQAKIAEYVSKRMERENQILEVLNRYQDRYITLTEMVLIIYPNLPKALRFGAQWNVLQHLDKLASESKVLKQDCDDHVATYKLLK